MEYENEQVLSSNFCFRGAGQEVGRSCIILEFKGKKIMVRMISSMLSFCYVLLRWHFDLLFEQLDCGIHPGLTGMDALPFVDLIEAHDIDLLLISQ